VGVAVSRLHALIVVARLKRKGIAQHNISALGAPGEIPEGLAQAVPPTSTGPGSTLHSVVGESVQVVGPLQERLAMKGGRTLEDGLRAAGLSGAQVSSVLSSVDSGRVVLWIEARVRGDLTVALDVFAANGVEDVYALAGEDSRDPFERASLFDQVATPGSNISGAVLA
jgi:hypothetical protein